MIGPLSNYIHLKIQRYSLPNLHFLGSKPFKDIPEYINKFDICILPYKENNRNKSVSSMKMYIYLALGKPIVGRPIADSEKFCDIISLSRGKQEFLHAIETLLISDTYEMHQKRISAAKIQNWNSRAEEIHNLIVESLQKGEDKRNKSVQNTKFVF